MKQPLLYYTLFVLCFLYSLPMHAQHGPKFSPDTVKAGIADMTRELALKHPGFYRYTPKAEFDRYIDSVKSTVRDSMTELEIFRTIKPIIGKVGCLHTGVYLSSAYNDSLDLRPNLLPFQVYFVKDRAFIVKNFSADKTVPLGAEIISINGKNIPYILGKLLPAIPSDGYNQTMKYLALYHMFPTWYRSMVEVTENFSLELRHNGQTVSYNTPGKRFADMAGNGFLKETEYPKQLEFRIEDGVGILAVHTFSASDIKRCKQKFRPFIDHVFRQLRTQAVQNLVLDLRYNTGGSDANAAYLCRYFFDKPFRYWDRIEVTESVAHEIKGAARLFYRKPERQDSVWLWKKSPVVRDFDFYETQKPAKHPYAGQLFVLINGFCMSSCADLAAVLSYHKKGVFIGEETGGGYEGNNSGIMPQTRLAPTSLTLTVPLQKYYNAVNPTPNPGHGTMPDHPVEITVADILQGHDKTLSYTLALIKKQQ